MTPYQNHSSPTCRRLAQDMQIRHMATATIDAYTYHVSKFEQFLGGQKPSKNPSGGTPEDIRSFQLHLIEVSKSWFQFLQSSRLWPTVALLGHDSQKLASDDDPVWQTRQETPHCFKRHRSRQAFIMHTQPQTSNVLHNTLCCGPATVRGIQLDTGRHRQPADATEHSIGQGPQAATSSALTTASGGVESVLERVSPFETVVPGQASGQTLCRNFDSKNHQGFGQARGHQQDRDTAHVETFLRDGIIGGGCRHPDNQPAVGPRQLQHDDGLLARSADPLAPHAQPAGLATDETASQVGRSQSGELGIEKRGWCIGPALIKLCAKFQKHRRPAQTAFKQHE